MVEIIQDTQKRTRHREVISLCRCFCGKEFESVKRQVKKGKVASCGCTRIKDLVGQKFGLLTVVDKTDKRNVHNGCVIWKCVCDCGEEREYSTTRLTNPKTKSCGCYLDNKIAACKAKAGKNHHWYNHELSDEDRTNRPGRYGFSKTVFERDDYTCQKCNKRGGELNAHHLNGYHWFVEGRDDIDNGVTLCEDCHNEFHEIYGQKNNTIEQYIEWSK